MLGNYAIGGGVEAGNLIEAKLLQQKYWSVFREYVHSQNSLIQPTKALPQHWMNISIGRSGFKMTAIASHYSIELFR